MIQFPTKTAPIALGTDVDLLVTSVVDHNGKPLDPQAVAFEFEFQCGKSAPYKVTPTEHSTVKDGQLHIILEGWPTEPGSLHYTEHFATDNALFADGKQDVRNHYYTNLQFVKL